MPPLFENPSTVPPPVARYSHVARLGNTLFISGQLAVDADGRVVGIGDAQQQARQIWANLQDILRHYGVGPEAIAKLTTFITHPAYRAPVGEARDEVYPAPPYPASTLVVVSALAEPQYLVEIEAVAVLD
jgi:enamine deaminase RidA (YjgF/YER057c/UK114 family)